MKASVFKVEVMMVCMLFFMALGCDKSDKEKMTSFTNIGQGYLAGAGSEGIPKQDIIIRTRKEWENLKIAMSSVNNVTDSFNETEIDFDKYQVLAIFDEIHYSGDWSTDVSYIMEYSDKIVVNVTVKNHDKGTSPQCVIQPYHIVKISATTKRVEFRYV